jgi:sugar/nucleoside kinase (ribokinase family)
MSLLCVGSVALDSVETPFGKRSDVLGGSATYFSTVASFFTPVRLVAVVGEDFPPPHVEALARRGIDVAGLERKPGQTFRWRGRYDWDLNTAHTLETQLNVFADFKPKIPAEYRSSQYVFLGNIDPVLQLEVLKQIERPKLVACDTMNFWIESKRKELLETLKHVDLLFVNDAEARELSEEWNIVKAARKILTFGPRSVVVKRGEYGCLFFTQDNVFAAPAYPLASLFDPTGAGDSFGGGFMGYLARKATHDTQHLRRAIVLGSVMASFAVEEFSLDRLNRLTGPEIRKRYHEFRTLTEFEALEEGVL